MKRFRIADEILFTVTRCDGLRLQFLVREVEITKKVPEIAAPKNP
jgi:hypothetical protein